MAITTIPSELQQKAWARDTYEAGKAKTFFNKFMGKSSDSIIHVKEELFKGSGTSITIPLLLPLKGAGITGDNMLEGNEEQLVYKDFNVELQRVRNAVRIAGKFEEHKTQYNMRTDAKNGLADWLARYIDCAIFSVLTGVLSTDMSWTTLDFPFPLELPSPDRVILAGNVANEAALTVTDKFTTDIIGKAKRKALETPDQQVRPITIDGKDTFVMVINQYQARDLKSDQKWVEAQQQGNVRGEKNPIFSGALGMWDGVVVHENNRIPRTDNGTTQVGHALLLGAQACVFAEGEPPEWREKTFDYDNQYGVSFGRMFGLKRSQFKYNGTTNTDFGVINVLTSAVDD